MDANLKHIFWSLFWWQVIRGQTQYISPKMYIWYVWHRQLNVCPGTVWAFPCRETLILLQGCLSPKPYGRSVGRSVGRTHARTHARWDKLLREEKGRLKPYSMVQSLTCINLTLINNYSINIIMKAIVDLRSTPSLQTHITHIATHCF